MMTDLQPTDSQLWSAAADGDKSAFGVLFDRHVRAVYNHCFRLTTSWTDAEDVTQQTFLTAWRRRAEVEMATGSVLPWLLAVAGHAVRDQRRTSWRWLRASRRVPPERMHDADLADDVAGRVDDERRMHEIRRAVNRLSAAEREALALCMWSGVSYRDAATVLNITETSVRSRVSRARARLTRALGDHITDEPKTEGQP